jgi:MFS family permease
VFGPLLIRPAEELGMSLFGWNQYTGPWIFSGLFFLTSLINTSFRLKPDPLEVAGGLNSQTAAGVPKRSFKDVWVVFRGSADGRLALTSMVISQMTMVAVMTMTPVHLKGHGHETVSAYVISLHIVGMYAFSPLIGKFSDLRGRYNTIMIGSLLLIGSTVMSALAGDSPALLFPSLWLLGIGWSFGLIGGSSLLVDSVATESRVRVQGTADLLMSFFGGMAGFSSGFIRKAIGFHWLSNLGTLLAAVLLISVIVRVGRASVQNSA